MLIEIKVAPKVSPDRKSESHWTSAPPGSAGAATRQKSPPVQPRRLSHVLLFTADVDASIEFYERTLGLRLSDRACDLVAFMHGIHGSDHHLLAIVKSSAPGFHHCSWDVGSINDIGLGAMRMADKGWTKGWGLGRHVLGSNYFHYVRDPWGSFSEYSCDIDYIPKEERWPVGRPQAGGFVLPLGSGCAARIHDQLRRRRGLALLTRRSSPSRPASPGLRAEPVEHAERLERVIGHRHAPRQFGPLSWAPTVTTFTRSGLTCWLSFRLMRRKDRSTRGTSDRPAASCSWPRK